MDGREKQDERLESSSAYLGEREKPDKEGKIFDLNNGSGYTEDLYGKKIQYYPWNSSSYGEPDGILGINCRHHKWPFVPGVNVQRHFPTEDMDANDKLYKQTQVQRALEREVRKQKRECMMLDAAGDQEGFEEASVKLKQTENKLKYYVKDTPGLHRRTDREQIVGFDKRLSAEAVAKNKKVQKEVALKIRNDKIKEELTEAKIRGVPRINPDKIDVSEFSFDAGHINAEREHSVSREEAERFIKEADISLTRWNGRFVNYYGPNGAVSITFS